MKLFNLTIFTILFFSISLNSKGQSLFGIIKDSITNEPIVYCNLVIANNHFGTITNKSGEFILFFPDSLINEDIQISCLGYKNMTLDIKDNLSKYITIKLSPQPYELNEIVINPTNMNGKTILKNVQQKYHQNYTRKLHFYKLFFRHKVRNIITGNYTRLTEAALHIQHHGFQTDKDPLIKIDEIRNSINFTELNKGRDFLSLISNVPKNPFHNIMLRQRLHFNLKFLRYLTKSGNYNIEIKDVVLLDKDIVYVINAKELYTKIFGIKLRNTRFYKEIDYYVNSEDWSVLKIDYRRISHVAPEMNFKDSTAIQIISSFQAFKNNYYLKYIEFHAHFRDQNEKFNEDNYYIDEGIVLFNEVIIDDKKINKIKRRNAFSKDESFWDTNYEYHPDFWERYNIILDNPLDEKTINDLEKNIPLKQQFNNSAKLNNNIKK